VLCEKLSSLLLRLSNNSFLDLEVDVISGKDNTFRKDIMQVQEIH